MGSATRRVLEGERVDIESEEAVAAGDHAARGAETRRVRAVAALVEPECALQHAHAVRHQVPRDQLWHLGLDGLRHAVAVLTAFSGGRVRVRLGARGPRKLRAAVVALRNAGQPSSVQIRLERRRDAALVLALGVLHAHLHRRRVLVVAGDGAAGEQVGGVHGLELDGAVCEHLGERRAGQRQSHDAGRRIRGVNGAHGHAEMDLVNLEEAPEEAVPERDLPDRKLVDRVGAVEEREAREHRRVGRARVDERDLRHGRRVNVGVLTVVPDVRRGRTLVVHLRVAVGIFAVVVHEKHGRQRGRAADVRDREIEVRALPCVEEAREVAEHPDGRVECDAIRDQQLALDVAHGLQCVLRVRLEGTSREHQEHPQEPKGAGD